MEFGWIFKQGRLFVSKINYGSSDFQYSVKLNDSKNTLKIKKSFFQCRFSGGSINLFSVSKKKGGEGRPPLASVSEDKLSPTRLARLIGEQRKLRLPHGENHHGNLSLGRKPEP